MQTAIARGVFDLVEDHGGDFKSCRFGGNESSLKIPPAVFGQRHSQEETG
jgi:hypothetical protein